MKFVKFIPLFAATLMSGCASIDKHVQVEKVTKPADSITYAEFESWPLLKLSRDDIISKYGQPDIIQHDSTKNIDSLVYLQSEYNAVRVVLDVHSKTGRLVAKGIDLRDKDGITTPDVLRLRYPKYKFKTQKLPWDNPHSMPHTYLLYNSELNIIATIHKPRNEVLGISFSAEANREIAAVAANYKRSPSAL